MDYRRPSLPNQQSISTPIDPLLCLRGLACLMVILGHCAAPRNIIFYQQYDLTWLIFSAGGAGVRIFFCLSGYLMGKVFYSGRYTSDFLGMMNFWRNRALRIFPLYYFAVFILSLLIYPDILKIANWGYLIRLLTFTYNQSLPVHFNGVLWSLSTEVQFYILVPFIYRYLKTRLSNLKQILFLALGILVLSALLRSTIWTAILNHVPVDDQPSYFNAYVYAPLLTNLDSFLCGFLVNAAIQFTHKNRVFSEININILGKSTSQIFAIFLGLLLYFWTAYLKYYIPQKFLFINPIMVASITALFIFTVELSAYYSFQKTAKNLLSWSLMNPLKLLEFIGVLSYGIYIWHLPILEKISPVLTPNSLLQTFVLKFTVTLILSTVLALITYYFIEIPAARLKIYKK